jgi:Ca-activated chloride channel family protein
VLIPVTVTDTKGRVVSGLEKEHFTLFENEVKQEITHFAAEDAPASIGLVVDGSDSMEPRVEAAREAVETILNNANSKDEFFLIRFSTEARVLVPMTSNADEIRNRMRSFRIRGSTALLDAVHLAIDEMKHAHHNRKAIIIVSDGEDNSSTWTVDELNAAVREEDIVIYSVGITEGAGLGPGWTSLDRLGTALLNEIASQTGGSLFEVKNLNQLHGIAATISGRLRNQYLLGYVPSRAEKDGTYRRIQLKISRPKGGPRRIHASWRQGYYAPKE